MTAASGATVRTTRVEQCMNTVFSFDLRDPGDWSAALDEAVAWLHRVDRLFSPYRDDSDVTAIQLEELSLQDADPLVREVAALCTSYEQETDGWFSAGWNGGFDPTGLVKGWAVERASEILRHHGSANHAVNGGGDVQTCGHAGGGAPWRVGVAHPTDPERIISTVTGFGIAVATSGTAERGSHILDPHTAAPVTALRSVTTSGPSLTAADVHATAAFAMGELAADWLRTHAAGPAVLVDLTGSVTSVTSETCSASPQT